MSLKWATLLAITGFVCSFLIRTVGTLLPHIFKNIHIAQMAIGIHLFASFALVIFFLSFYEHYTQKKQQILRRACFLAIIGSLAALFLHIKILFLVFGQHIFPLFLMHHHIDAILPLVSSITVILFFMIFQKEMRHGERKRLGKATRSAVIGFSVFAILQTTVLINYLSSSEFRWLEHFPRKVAIGTIPVMAFAILAVLYFFLSFYRFVEVSVWEK